MITKTDVEKFIKTLDTPTQRIYVAIENELACLEDTLDPEFQIMAALIEVYWTYVREHTYDDTP